MITQERILINIHRLKLNKHTDSNRLNYWMKQQKKYAAIAAKRGTNG